jgi:putative sigma-54 modulation protein
MTLKVEIFTQNMELNDRINDYVDKKFAKLDRFLTGIEDTRLDLSFEKTARNVSDRYVAQITIRGKGFILRSEERSEDIFTAIDAAIDKIQRQIERFKGKRFRGRGQVTPRMEIPETIEFDEEEESSVVARRKKFTLVPMDELEAIEQMRLLGHENFFIFFNANTSAINVLYRRRNGDYGLIEPQIG